MFNKEVEEQKAAAAHLALTQAAVGMPIRGERGGGRVRANLFFLYVYSRCLSAWLPLTGLP